jgi:hypothetical protein
MKKQYRSSRIKGKIKVYRFLIENSAIRLTGSPLGEKSINKQ